LLKRGHAAILTAALEDGDDLLAIHVRQERLRTEKIGTAHIAAAEVGAVAAVALDAVEGFAALDSGGVAGFTLLARNETASATALGGKDERDETQE
jgi:hypothetical protein